MVRADSNGIRANLARDAVFTPVQRKKTRNCLIHTGILGIGAKKCKLTTKESWLL
jgi:hypothetical protein